MTRTVTTTKALRALFPLRTPRTISLFFQSALKPSEAALAYWTAYSSTFREVIRLV